ncbi:hypothetical protein BCR44DRAFT_1425079 [Catenaria anguillulae PL171]|uniref:Fatty acid hydroxylase domain-containing protein n=1 Tax=Catenaria anguillulae PL171 TaxID=765915 RepID=A0A1Y2I130_9FUNG|nr:hypothetical protein BCR44DRAFT_1425079 [Catenaria anguillulae PL171]
MTTTTLEPPAQTGPSTTGAAPLKPVTAATADKPRAASPIPEPTKLPGSLEILLRGFSLEETAHPLLFAALVVLVCSSPALFELGAASSPLPSWLRSGLSLVPGAKWVAGKLLDASLAGKAGWAKILGAMGVGGLVSVGLFSWTTTTYYTHSGILSLLDLALRYPKSWLGRFAKAHKIQDTKLVTKADWIKALKVVVRNQLTINIPLGLLYFQYVLFYFTHRLFHWRPLYQRFHKKHHEFTAPIGLAATYAHPLEHIISNLTPVMGGPAFFGLHPFTALVWLTFAIQSTIHHHSGYELWGWPSARKHDWHHYSFIYQFGVSGLLDKALGTEGGERFQRYVWKYDQRVKMIREGN